MDKDLLTGPLRALVPAFVAYAVGKGWIPAGSAAEIGAAIMALAAAGWSIRTNLRSQKVADVAAMPGTDASPNGKVITIVEPALQQAAKEAATPPSGVKS